MAIIFAIVVFIQQNLSAILQIQQATFFALSALFQLLKMPRTSKFFGTFGVDGGRLLRWIGNLGITTQPKSWLELILKLAAKFKLTAALFVIAFVPLGCAGTFEEARLAQPVALQAAPVRLSSDRCEALSDREYWFGVTSVATGSTGAGAVLAVIPASDKYESTLLIAGASAAAISIVSGVASQRAGASYVREGCAK